MDCSPFSLFQIKHDLDRLEINLKQCVDEAGRKEIQDEIERLKEKATQIHPSVRKQPAKNTINIQHNYIFTLEQLAKSFNGKNGNPLYIAVDGLVFDVSELSDTSDHEELDFLLKHAVLVGHVKDY